MTSMEEEMEDSRISAVGRKRSLDELQDDDSSILRPSSSENDAQGSPKRAKEFDEPSEDTTAKDGVIINTASPSSVASPSLPIENSSTPPTTVAPPRPVAWNRGVQSSLRTSFGSRVKTNTKSTIPSARDEVTPNPSNSISDATKLPEMEPSTSVEQDDGEDVHMVDATDTPQKETSHVFEQDEPDDRSVVEEPSLPQVEMDISSEEEEGEISSSNDSEEDVDAQPQQSSGAFGQYTKGENSFSNGAVNNAGPLQARRLHDRHYGQPAGDVSVMNPQPREIFERRPSSSTSDAEDMDEDTKSASQPKHISSAAFKLLTTAEEGQLSVGERVRYMQQKKDHLKEQKRRSNFSKRINSFNRLTAEAEAIFEHELPPLSQKYDLVTQNLSSGLTFFPRKVNKTPIYQKNNMDYTVTEIFDKGRPIRIQDFSFDVFAPAFLKENPSGWEPITLKVLIAAFNMYRTAFYSIHALELVGGPRVSIDSPQMANTITVEEAKRQAKLLLPAGESISTKDAPDNQEEVPPAEPVEIDINHPDVNPLDRELQQKYFPAATGHPASYHCLACGDKCHMMIDCPSLTCVSCGDNHALSSCPRYQRCDKCCNRGHKAADCPEKLALSKGETVGCDLCGSTDHLEKACHFIWRTYYPKVKEIRKVRDIAVHCYICGGTGHYGPECGLYNQGRIYSGGGTWSKANLLKYIDASSIDRAMSAGIDYSIGSRSSKGFSIKGKANNPIDLDDSYDEDVAFISEKVKKPKQNGQIKIAGTARLGQPPQEANLRRAPNPPRQSRPDFGRKSASNLPPGVDSARYGRERTFSPPPSFDDMRYGFPDADDQFRPQAPQQRENSYRPRPQQAQSNYQSAPQGSLPVRTPSMDPSNAPRSGHAGRGGRGGGNNGRGSGEKRRKKSKGANRGGGANGNGAPRRGK